MDTATAYYRIVREIVLGTVVDDETVFRIPGRFGLDETDMQQLIQLVQSGGILTQLGIGDHLLAILKDLYARSWFITRFYNGRQVNQTLLGSRPGSVFADLIFAFSYYHRVLAKIRSAAIDEGLQVDVPWDGCKFLWSKPGEASDLSCPALDVSWADDTAAMTAAQTPHELLPRARRLVELVLNTCSSHGLQPNLKKGKSALMIALRGAGSRRVAAEAFPGDDRMLEVTLGRGKKTAVHVVAMYVHLGTALDRDGCFLGESRRRVAMVGQAFTQLRSLVLQNDRLDMSARATLFRTGVESALFNMELWHEGDFAWKCLEMGFWRLQRRLLAKAFHHDMLFKLQLTKFCTLQNRGPSR